jgi:hypothetical protein
MTMPDDVKIHAQERLDKDDAQAIADTGNDHLKQHDLRVLLSDRPVGGFVLDGFRIALDLVAATVTVYNGIAVDRDGQEIGDSESYIKSKNIVLTSDGTHYIMVEYRQDDTQTDARAFMDPTFDNGTDPSGDPRPQGREFTLQVPTRKHPTWQIVTNKTGFPAQIADPYSAVTRSVLVPLATVEVFAGAIIGATQVSARTTILQEYTALGLPQEDWVLVNDARLFAIGPVATVTLVDELGVVQGAGLPLATISQENNSLQITGIGALNPEIGWVIQSDSAATYLTYLLTGGATDQEFTLPQVDQISEVAFQQGLSFLQDPDAPVAGTTVFPNVTTTDVPTARTPQNIRDLGSFFWAMTSVVREMKFGASSTIAAQRWADGLRTGTLNEVYNARIDESSTGVGQVPTYQTLLRDREVANKEYITTVGDGVISFGDWNGVQGLHDLFVWLLAQEVAATTFSGKILIKEGTYDWNTIAVPVDTITIFSRGITLEGTARDEVIMTNVPTWVITNNGLGAPLNLAFKNMSITTKAWAGGLDTGNRQWLYVTGEPADGIEVVNCIVSGGGFENATATQWAAIDLAGVGAGNRVDNVSVKGSTINLQEGGRGVYLHQFTERIKVIDCVFNWFGLGAVITGAGLQIDTITYGVLLGHGYGVEVRDNKFIGFPSTITVLQAPQCVLSAQNAALVKFERNYFDAQPFTSGIAAASARLGRTPLEFGVGLFVTNCEDTQITIGSCYFGSFEKAIDCSSSASVTVEKCTFEGCNIGIEATAEDTTTAVIPLSHVYRDNDFLGTGHLVGATADQLGCLGIWIKATDLPTLASSFALSGNYFEGLAVGVYVGEPGDAAGDYEDAIEAMTINGNVFKDILNSAVFVEDWFSEDDTFANDDEFGLETLSVRGNEFTRCCLSPESTNFSGSAANTLTTNGNTAEGTVIHGAGAVWNVSDNSFNGCYVAGPVAVPTVNRLIYGDSRCRSATICNNEGFDSFPNFAAGPAYYYVDMRIGFRPVAVAPNAPRSTFKFDNNSFGRTGTNLPNVVTELSGVQLRPSIDWTGNFPTSDVVDGLVVDGSVSDNTLDLMNPEHFFFVDAWVVPMAAARHLTIGNMTISDNVVDAFVRGGMNYTTPNLIDAYCFGTASIDRNVPIGTTNETRQQGGSVVIEGNTLAFRILDSYTPVAALAGYRAIKLWDYPGRFQIGKNTCINGAVEILSSMPAAGDLQGDYDVQYILNIGNNIIDLDNFDDAAQNLDCLLLQTVTGLPNTVGGAPGTAIDHQNQTTIESNQFRVRNTGGALPTNSYGIYIHSSAGWDAPNIAVGNHQVTISGNTQFGCINRWNGAAAPDWAGVLAANLKFSYFGNTQAGTGGTAHWSVLLGAPQASAGGLIAYGNMVDGGLIDPGVHGGAGDGM